MAHLAPEETVDGIRLTIPARILLVGEDIALRRELTRQLSLHREFTVIETDTGAGAVDSLGREHFDAVLLNVGPQGSDGCEICRLIRRRGIHIPVILLADGDSVADVILGLDAGANDYIASPFKYGILVARLRAHLRQYELSEDAILRIGPYVFRPTVRALHHSGTGREIRLSDKECAILKYLCRAGDAVSCDRIYSDIWDHNEPLMTHTLQTHIYRLRQKIENNPSKPEIIVSEMGGYRIAR